MAFPNPKINCYSAALPAQQLQPGLPALRNPGDSLGLSNRLACAGDIEYTP